MTWERFYLLKRPGVDDLLRELATSRSYEVVVFSAAAEEYVDAVVDKLLLGLPESIADNFIPPTHRLGRDSCTYSLRNFVVSCPVTQSAFCYMAKNPSQMRISSVLDI